MADVASACAAVAEVVRSYHGIGGNFELFGRQVVPYEKGTDEFYWYLLLRANPDGGLPPESSSAKRQSPREACHGCKDLLSKSGFDVEYILRDDIQERVLDIVQVAASSNFLDKKAYKSIAGIKESKLMMFMAKHGVVARSSELPKFLSYDMLVFTNTTDRCIELGQTKSELRNQPATLLTLSMQTLTPEVEIYGKAFVVANDRPLTPEEMREIVIFCMGQAEALELKLTSWEKLRAALQDEARKFAESAQYIKYIPK